MARKEVHVERVFVIGSSSFGVGVDAVVAEIMRWVKRKSHSWLVEWCGRYYQASSTTRTLKTYERSKSVLPPEILIIQAVLGEI